MEKTLNFTVDGKNYKLGFNRDTVVATENMGFIYAELYTKPVKSLTLLWHGAFIEHHPDVSYEERVSLFERIAQKKKGATDEEKNTSLLDALSGLYLAPIESLMDEEHEKNAITWAVN